MDNAANRSIKCPQTERRSFCLKRKSSFRFGVSVNSTYNMFQLSDLAAQYLSTRPEGERCDGCNFVFNLTEVHVRGKKFFCQHCLNGEPIALGMAAGEKPGNRLALTP